MKHKSWIQAKDGSLCDLIQGGKGICCQRLCRLVLKNPNYFKEEYHHPALSREIQIFSIIFKNKIKNEWMSTPFPFPLSSAKRGVAASSSHNVLLKSC